METEENNKVAARFARLPLRKKLLAVLTVAWVVWVTCMVGYQFLGTLGLVEGPKHELAEAGHVH